MPWEMISNPAAVKGQSGTDSQPRALQIVKYPLHHTLARLTRNASHDFWGRSFALRQLDEKAVFPFNLQDYVWQQTMIRPIDDINGNREDVLPDRT